MNIRTAVFQLHWLFGITAGFVLAIMGVTGTLIAFEDEIMTALSDGIVTVAPSPGPRLSPDQLIATARAQNGGARVSRLLIHRDPAKAALVMFERPPGQRERGRSYADPVTGLLLGDANGTGFFRFVNDLHRWLAVPNGRNSLARQVTGLSTIALVFFALSGLYLRWPRRALAWRSWFRLDLRKRGHHLHRELHVTVGTWLIPLYLLSGLTGLWWSYDWYHRAVHYALTGRVDAEKQGRSDPARAPAELAPLWTNFLAMEGARYQRALILMPTGSGPVVIRMLPIGARFDRMHDELSYDPASGRRIGADRYADRNVGETIASNIYALHTGAFFGLPGRVVLLASSLTMPLFTVTGLLLYLRRRRTARAAVAARRAAGAGKPIAGGNGPLIVHASQTGTAERLAWLTAGAFGGGPVRSFADITIDDLRASTRVIFVVATYGEGEPPDSARTFARAMAHPADLSDTDYAMLALGDSGYPDFCAFAHALGRWLDASGARPLFATIEMDGDDPVAERAWFDAVATIGATVPVKMPQEIPFTPWPLVARERLNPGSAGAALFRIALRPPADARWQPGAVVEVVPGDAPRADGHPRPRDYSVASIDTSGIVELVVRQCFDKAGRPGAGSGWLTDGAAIGGAVQARLRTNSVFAPPADPATPLVLIGNGSGIAGLIAHLRHRARIGGGPAWLIFGERNAAYDRLYGAELDAMLRDGVLTRCDRAFSRDTGCGRYVQHLLTAHAEDITAWSARGAAFYICGSLAGMAPAVDDALRAILGDDAVGRLTTGQRYRRDIY